MIKQFGDKFIARLSYMNNGHIFCLPCTEAASSGALGLICSQTLRVPSVGSVLYCFDGHSVAVHASASTRRGGACNMMQTGMGLTYKEAWYVDATSCTVGAPYWLSDRALTGA